GHRAAEAGGAPGQGGHRQRPDAVEDGDLVVLAHGPQRQPAVGPAQPQVQQQGVDAAPDDGGHLVVGDVDAAEVEAVVAAGHDRADGPQTGAPDPDRSRHQEQHQPGGGGGGLRPPVAAGGVVDGDAGGGADRRPAGDGGQEGRPGRPVPVLGQLPVDVGRGGP